MPRKSKADELYNRISSGQVDRYFRKLNNTDFNELSRAIADDDIGWIIDILSRNLKSSFDGFESALNSNYDAEITQLANRILQQNYRPKRRVIFETLPEIREIIRPPREKKLKKPIDVTMPTGKRYRRTKGKNYTTRETKFLQNRINKTGSEVYKDYLETFGNIRTKSAVTTKFYRVR